MNTSCPSTFQYTQHPYRRMYKKIGVGSSSTEKSFALQLSRWCCLSWSAMVLSLLPWLEPHLASSRLYSLSEGLINGCTVFALLGFLSPSNRGSLATVMIVCWSFFGWLVTYFEFWYKANEHNAKYRGLLLEPNVCFTWRDKQKEECISYSYSVPDVSLAAWCTHSWSQRSMTLTWSSDYSGIFAIIFVLNFFLVTAGSSGAVPFGELQHPFTQWNLTSTTPRNYAPDNPSVVRYLCPSFCHWCLFWFQTRCTYLSIGIIASRSYWPSIFSLSLILSVSILSRAKFHQVQNTSDPGCVFQFHTVRPPHLHFLTTKQVAAILSGILPFGTFFHRLHDTPDLAPDIGIGRRCICRNVLCPFEPFCIKSVLRIRIPRPHSWHCLTYNSDCDNLVHIFLPLCWRV